MHTLTTFLSSKSFCFLPGECYFFWLCFTSLLLVTLILSCKLEPPIILPTDVCICRNLEVNYLVAFSVNFSQGEDLLYARSPYVNFARCQSSQSTTCSVTIYWQFVCLQWMLMVYLSNCCILSHLLSSRVSMIPFCQFIGSLQRLTADVTCCIL